MKKPLFPVILLLLLLSAAASAQSLFDSAVSGSAEESRKAAQSTEKSADNSASDNNLFTGNENPGSAAEFSGTVKGLITSSVNRADEDFNTENSYTEFRGKISASPSDNLKAFSEIVIKRTGTETSETKIDLREAYVDIYSGIADFTIGEKIIVWGRADAVNPTNKITPYKNGIISSDEDDRRAGNLLARVKINLYPFTLSAVWIPLYKQTELPSFIDSTLADSPSEIDNSSLALKTDFENSTFDFSVSYFNGYNPSPGISEINGGTMVLKPYRIQMIGFDFSTAVSDYGLRGETAFQMPFKDHENIYVPSPELSYIAGIDRSFGDLTLILQYYGKYITDFIEEHELTAFSPIETATENYNRIISSQTVEISHSVLFRLSLDLLYETLSLETAGSWNFTTEELLLRPLLVWDAADSLEVSAGAFFYAGKDNTLYGMMEEKGSSVFTGVKLCF